MIEASRKAEDFKYSTTVREIPFWVTLLPYILMVVLFLVFLFIFMNQGNAGANRVMNFGKSRARIYTTSNITFADVAGADEEKEELMELVSFEGSKKIFLIGSQNSKRCFNGWTTWYR